MSRLWNNDGSVAVDRKKCPTLHRCLELGSQSSREAWQKVVTLRLSGQGAAADREIRKILGIKGEPMDEETKAKLREYNEAHKEEIKEAKRQRRVDRRIQSRATGRRMTPAGIPQVKEDQVMAKQRRKTEATSKKDEIAEKDKAYAAKYPHYVKGSVGRDADGHLLAQIKCVDCGSHRSVHPGDVFQVKKCSTCRDAKPEKKGKGKKSKK